MVNHIINQILESLIYIKKILLLRCLVIKTIQTYMSIPQSQMNPSIFGSNVSKLSLNIYCQPCLKRGLLNIPAYVNLNEFESSRYICESCSFGQTYIIALGKEFLSDKRKDVKMENKLKTIKEDNQQQNITQQNLDTQKVNESKSQTNKELETDHTDTTQSISEIQDNQQNQETPQITQFVKNIQINSNPYQKYSTADIETYTKDIKHQYQQAMDIIDKYEQMINLHVKKWKNKLQSQFQGVIGTFANTTVDSFLNELKIMEEMQKNIKFLEQIMKNQKEHNIKSESQQIKNHQKQTYQKTKINHIKSQLKSFKTNIKSQQNSKQSLNQLYEQSLNAFKQQKQKIGTYVETLKMSGIRNLSNLKSLYNCCQGFSDAVKILISLEQKETNRRFDFISQKFKTCSIETLYDAQMINGGYLDNRLQRPPGFDVIRQQNEKKKFQQFIVKKSMKEDICERKHFQSHLLKQVPDTKLKIAEDNCIKTVVSNSQNMIKQAKENQQRKPLPHQISLISSQSQHEQSSMIQMSQDEIIDKKSQHQVLSEFKTLTQSKHVGQVRQKSLKQEIMNNKIQLQKQVTQEREKMAKMRSKKPFESGLLNRNLMEREDANQIFKMQKKKQNYLKQGHQTGINLQSQPSEMKNTKDGSQESIQNPNSLFPGLRQYFQYQKGQNVYVSKLQLTQENFQTFPPNNIYMPSVESLTIKYCPPATDPLQLLKNIKSCFKKLNQLFIQEPKLGTKPMIIMIAEYFPKLKSLVFRCNNEFDWELGKLFEKKMGHLVRFEANREMNN